MYIARKYSSERDKGYLNDYEKVETQVLTIPHYDARSVPFKIWGFDGDTISITPYSPVNVYEQPSNTIGTNMGVSDEGLRIDYSIEDDYTCYLYGDVRLYYDGIFYIPIQGLEKGNYKLILKFTKQELIYTTTLPLIST